MSNVTVRSRRAKGRGRVLERQGVLKDVFGEDQDVLGD